MLPKINLSPKSFDSSLLLCDIPTRTGAIFRLAIFCIKDILAYADKLLEFARVEFVLLEEKDYCCWLAMYLSY